MDANEQRARELLAAEYEARGYSEMAEDVKSGKTDWHNVFALRAIMAALAQQVPADGEWHDLNESMPEPEVFVLTWDGKSVGVDWWGSLRHRGDGVTHWCAFRAPPGAGPMYGLQSATPQTPQPVVDGDVSRALEWVREVGAPFTQEERAMLDGMEGGDR